MTKPGYMKVYLAGGTCIDFPHGADSAPAVVAWFREAEPGQVISLNTETGVAVHVQKRHITNIEVAP